jgi:hypothetical protein
MKRKPAATVFNPYIMHQDQLLPPSYDEVIPAGYLVRVVNEVIEKLDLSVLRGEYEG